MHKSTYKYNFIGTKIILLLKYPNYLLQQLYYSYVFYTNLVKVNCQTVKFIQLTLTTVDTSFVMESIDMMVCEKRPVVCVLMAKHQVRELTDTFLMFLWYEAAGNQTHNLRHVTHMLYQ